ncbi:MAG: hypothetical protein IKB41_03615 [Clostridia bacterium]|nr:hypothetical protein [Clostridia bacterium]
MTGLDKIIDRILGDAKERAREILESAQNDCRQMAQDFAARAAALRAEIAEDAQRKGEALVSRAKSAAAMERRNLLLKTKNALIDEAFEAARAEVLDTDFGKYRELLTALLAQALVEEAKNAERSLAFGDEVTEFDTYEVLMNEEDRAAYGAAVVEGAKRAALRHIGEERAAKVRLSESTADIDGGLILRYGNIEANCSLSMLLGEMRRSLESKVAAILFATEDNETTAEL